MHELILEMVQMAPAPVALSRLPLDDGALVVGFAVGGDRRQRAQAPPLWVGKTGYGSRGCRRLRAEAQALGQLEGLAGTLPVPRLLGWRESEVRGEAVACLVQSGMAGTPMEGAGPRGWGSRGLPAALLAAGDWLRRFQRLADAQRLAGPRRGLTELAAEACARAENEAEGHAELAPLLTALSPVVAHAAARAEPGAASVPMHGDFWAENILAVRPVRSLHDMSVIDWSGLGAGSALDDLLTFTANLSDGAARRERLGRWQELFFAPGRVRDYLRDWAAAAGYGDRTARLAFYLFLLRRLVWELGLGLQTRSAGERAQARAEWSEVLAWLAQRRYPDPFLPMPS
ncbi:MAG TPA: phosphotransferase [Terriglobales bacterium]|nr:phosphotransferase [Terriglobales bacterium]